MPTLYENILTYRPSAAVNRATMASSGGASSGDQKDAVDAKTRRLIEKWAKSLLETLVGAKGGSKSALVFQNDAEKIGLIAALKLAAEQHEWEAKGEEPPQKAADVEWKASAELVDALKKQ